MFDGIELNSGRSCLRYIVRVFNIKEIYIPFYTCPVVWQTLKQENCKIYFYHINSDFLPDKDLPENAYIIYTNYFGICSENVKKLADKYKKLIVDNAQALFMPKLGLASFYSIRKFLPVKDGAILISDEKLNCNFNRDNTIIKNNNCIENKDSLNSKEILLMSKTTKRLVKSIDLDEVKQKRLSNFDILHTSLKQKNELKIIQDTDNIPMYYPFLCFDEKTEKALRKNNIEIEKLWNPYPMKTQEGIFQKHLILLPVSQKYNFDDMQRIINIINGQ